MMQSKGNQMKVRLMTDFERSEFLITIQDEADPEVSIEDTPVWIAMSDGLIGYGINEDAARRDCQLALDGD